MTMPQGPSGLEPDAWMSEWVNKAKTPGTAASKHDLSNLHGRTRTSVENYYKASLPISTPWTGAQTALFTNLMGGYSSLTSFLEALAETIAGSGKKTLAHIAEAIALLSNSASATQTMIDLKSAAGANLMLSPTFVNTLVKRFSYHSSPDSADGYSIEKAHSGLSSWKWKQKSATDCGLVFAPAQVIDSFEVKAGEQYFLEAWIQPKSTNPTTAGSVRLGGTFKDGSGALADVNVYDSFELSSAYMIPGQWNKVSKTITVPTGYESARFWLYATAATAANSIFYIDDVTVREVTDARAAQQTADDSLTYAGEVVSAGSNLIKNPGFETGRFAQLGSSFSTEQARSGSKSLKITGNGFTTVSYTLLSDGTTPRNISVSDGDIFYAEFWVRGDSGNQTSGNNAIRMSFQPNNSLGIPFGDPILLSTNMTSALNTTWTKVSDYVLMPTGARSMTIKLELTSAVSNNKSYYFDDITVREVTLPKTVEVTAGETKTTADATKVNLQTTVDGVNQAVEGDATPANAAPTTVKDKLRKTWGLMWHGLNKSADGTVVGLDKLPTDLFTIGRTTRTQADLGVEQAGIAGGKADMAQTSLDTKARDFGNLAAGSDFDGASIPWTPLETGWALDSTQYHSASQSLKNVSSTAVKAALFNNDVKFEAKPGEQFYMELWARRSSDCTSTGDGGNSQRLRCIRGNGPSVGTTIDNVYFTATQLPLANTWYKLTKTVTVIDDGTSSVFFRLHGLPAGAAGSVWIDDIVIRRVAQADHVAELPQGKVTGLTTDLPAAQLTADKAKSLANATSGRGANIATDPGFENTFFNHGLTSGAEISTAAKNSGTRSVKLTGVASGYTGAAVICDDVGTYTQVPCSPGDIYYVEYYVMGNQTANTTSGGTAYLEFVVTKTDGSTASLKLSADKSSSGAWVKYSGHLTIPPLGSKFTAGVYLGPNAGTNTAYFFDDIVIREVTIAQSTVDGVQQAVEGGTTTGNTPATVKSKLLKAWSSIYHGLAKDATIATEDKLPGQIYTVGLTTRNQADLGVSQAGTANTGVTQAKSLASSTIKSGSNLVADPGFENSNFFLYESEGASRFSTDAKYVRNGIYSLKFTTNGTNSRVSLFLTDNDSYAFVPCAEGDVFYVEAWVKGASTNTATTGQIYLSGVVRKGSSAAPTLAYPSIGTTITPAQCKAPTNTTAGADWVKLSGYVTMPAGAYEWTPRFVIYSDVATGNVFYLDDVVVREVTAGSNAQTTADGASTTANKAVDYIASGTNLIPDPGFENTSRDAERTANFTTSSGTYTHDTFKRSGSRSLKFTCSGTGGGGVYFGPTLKTSETIPTRAGASFKLSQWVYASTGNTGANKVGVYIWCTDSTGANAGVWVGDDYTIPAEGTWYLHEAYLTVPAGRDTIRLYMCSPRPSNVAANDQFWFDDIGAFEVTESVQTADNVVAAVDGGTPTGSKPADAKTKLLKAWSSIWHGLNKDASITTFDKLPGDVYTVGLTTRNRAELGVEQAGTANTGVTQAKSIASSAIASGSNLVADPGFENSNLYFYTSEGAVRQSTDTAYIRNGTYSAKITSNGTSSRGSYFLTDSDSIAYLPCSSDDVFYVEGYVKGAFANTATTGSIYLSSRISTGSSAAPVVTYINIGTSITPAQCKAPDNTTRATGWVKLSGYVTMPANAYEWTPLLVVGSNIATGQIFYLDDVVVREVTLAAATNNALYGQTTPGSTVAQDKVSGLPDDLGTLYVKGKDPTNLAAGSDFEDAKQPWVSYGSTTLDADWASVVTASATEFANSGTKSLKIVPTSSAQSTIYYLGFPHYFEAKAGEQFYLEAKVRKSATFTNTDPTNPRIRVVRGNGTNNGTTIFNLNLITANIPTADTWVTLSATGTVPSDGTSQIYLAITGPVQGTMAGSLWVDDIILRRVNTSATIADSSIVNSKLGQLAVKNANVDTGLGGDKITTGTVAETRLDLNTTRNLARGRLGSGANLVSNPGFELTTFYEASFIDTAIKRSGSRALKLTADGTVKSVHLFCDESTFLTIPASENDEFYVEGWVRWSGTVPTAGNVYFSATPYDANGAAIGSDLTAGSIAASTLTTSFAKISGYLDMPAGTTKVAIKATVGNTVTTGTIVWWDDVVIKEYTYHADTNNTLFGQRTPGSNILDTVVPQLPRKKNRNTDLTNLLEDPGFENGTSGVYNGTYTIATLASNAVPVGGTKVLQMVSTGAIVDVNLEPYGIPVAPGETYYMEYYVRKTTTGTTGTVGLGTSIGLNGTGGWSYPSLYTSMSSLTQNTWSKVSAIITVPASTNFMVIRASVRNDVPAGQTIQFDNIVVRKATSTDLLVDLAVTNSKVSGAAEGGIDASKLGQGFLNQARVLNLTTDLGDLQTTTSTTNSNIAQTFLADADATGAKALDGLKAIFTNVSTAWKAIQALQSSKSASATKGGTWEVNFADYASVTAAGFTLTYSGSGTSTIGITNGIAQWNVLDSLSRDAKLVYNTSTLTDFQTIRGTMSAPPQAPSGTTPYFYAIARSDSSGNSYVFARAYAVSFGNYKCDMGYVLNGVETLWVTGVALSWSLDMRFVAGVGTNKRSYQVWSGNSIVKEWDETYVNGASGTVNESRSLLQGDWLVSRGAATAGTFTLTYDGSTTAAIQYNAAAATVKAALGNLGKGTFFVNSTTNGWYINPPDSTKTFTGTGSLTGGTLTVTQQTGVRRWGAIAQVRNQKTAGKVEYASATDSGTPSVNGSTARMVRTATATEAYATGFNAVPNSFFDSVPYESLDVDAVTSTGSFKVTSSKSYAITGRLGMNGSPAVVGSLLLQLSTNNGSTWTTVQYGDSSTNTDSLTGSWIQYLNAGEMVRLAWTRTGAGIVYAFVGESTGAQTYFSISAFDSGN